MIVNSIGIEMPADFPSEEYNRVHARTQALQPRFPDVYAHHAGAWNAVAIRFRAMAESHDVFQSSLKDFTPQPEERFLQETALFHFFSNSMSVLDSFAYAIHALGHMVDPPSFVLTGKALKVDFRGVVHSFQKQFLTDPFSAELISTEGDSLLVELRDLRNVLTHRVASTRSYISSEQIVRWHIGHLEPVSGLQSLVIDSALTPRYRTWIAARLSVLFAELRGFVQSRL